MQVPSHKVLLRELDSLGYGARLARVSKLGRDARGTPALAALMDELEHGDAHEGGLAMELARSARDEAGLLRGLFHPSLFVRCRAARYAGAFVRDDAALERVLPRLSPRGRKCLLQGIAQARRRELGMRLFPQVVARHGADEALPLLPLLDAPTLARALPELGHRVKAWHALVYSQGGEVLRYLQGLFTAAPERERRALFFRYSEPLGLLTLSHSADVLALARDFAEPGAVPSAIERTLRLLTRRHPDQVFALLSRPASRAYLLAAGVPRGALLELDSFTPEQQLALARALADAPHHLAALLRGVPPSRRAELFAHAFQGVPARLLPDALLWQLPHALRDAEAARMLCLREVQEERARHLSTLAFRAIEQAREPLTRAAFAALAEDRAQALSLLIRCTGLSRRGMTETLAQLSRLKNEQDPVRLAALQALAEVPPTVFLPEHVPALSALADWVVEARDTSHATRGALQALAFQLMRANATRPDGPLFQHALDTLKKLAGQSGTLSLPPLERNLPRGAELRIVSALLPAIRSAATRESYALVLALATSLGRRAWNVDLLQPLLEPITEATPDWLAQTAIRLWLAPPPTRDARVRRLLDRDETVVTNELVFAHLHRRRQEWLDPFLQGRALRGRFLTGKTGYVPPARSGFHRWLPRQQRSLAAILLRVAGEAQRSVWERTSVLHVLSLMPVMDAATLAPFMKDKDVPIAEAALGALAWLDRPQDALAPLLEHLDTDRARVAMYAVPRVARLVDGEALAAALEPLLERKLKVTVRKEVVRLLGTFRSERSLSLLAREAADPTLHRDVRIAVGHAARQMLDTDGGWRLLGGLAASPDAYVAQSLLDQAPTALAPEARPRYLDLVLQVARHPELTVRRRAFGALPAWSAGAEDKVARVAAERVRDLAGGPEWREATQALVEVVRDGRAGEQVVATTAALLEPAPASMNASPDRDLPGRQRLLGLCGVLLGLPHPVRLRASGLLREVARTLGTEPTLQPLAARLQLAGVDWRDADALAEELSRLWAGAKDEPLFTGELLDNVKAGVDACAAEWTPEALLAASDRLLGEAPLLAVPLVEAAGARLDWREEAARRLRALREHPRLAVRAAARAVFTAKE